MGRTAVLKQIVEFLNEYLRINAVRRMFAVVEIKTSEITALVFLAVLYAMFEGVGLSLLLPALQFAESGQTAITSGSGVIWTPVSLRPIFTLGYLGLIVRFMGSGR